MILLGAITTLSMALTVQTAQAAPPTLVSVACPSSSECVAVGEGGRELTFDPLTHHTLASAALAGGHDLASVACPSTTQCTAVDGYAGSVYAGGDETTFNPLAPGSPGLVTIASGRPPGTRLLDLACPSVSECVAEQEGVGFPGGGKALSFNPSSPGTPAATLTGLRGFQPIACSSPSQCTLVDAYDRTEVTIDPVSGVRLSVANIDKVGYLADVACPSTSECVAADRAGHEVTFNPTSPATHPLVRIVGPCSPKNRLCSVLTSVACPMVGQCTAVSDGGLAVTFDPASPRHPIVEPLAERKILQDVACPSASECVAVGKTAQPVVFRP